MTDIKEQIDRLNACAQWIETRRHRDIDRDFAEVMRNSAKSLELTLAVVNEMRGLIGLCEVELREVAGNTNVNCAKDALAALDSNE